MVDVDVLKAQLVRQDLGQPWGFRLQGGADISEQLTIIRVTPGSPAAKIGLEPRDEVVEIADTSTASLTHQQALDLIATYSNTLLMTVERRVRGNTAYLQTPYANTATQNNVQPPRSYQPMNMTGSVKPAVNATDHAPNRPFDFHTVQARPFESRRAPGSVVFQPPYHSTTTPAAAQPPYQQNYYYSPPEQLKPEQHEDDSYSSSLRHYGPDDGTCPQSRTFKMLQTVMHNEEPAAGVSGLPPPRSATMEQMKLQRQGGSQRVKVFMPQQYNSPMGMYSAHNVLETFTAQAESMLDSMQKRKQQAIGDEYEPVRSSTATL